MSDIPKLGLLKSVPLREAWPNEATSFTPWLHNDENMTALGEALGLEQLSALGLEQAVGSFSADLLAEDVAGNRVVIENQLEQSDHDHLGKCLTYAAGLDAKIIVWVCAKFRDEHRAAIDWLNDASTDEFSFFAVEIELYQIGDSEFAPRFNVAAHPNNWIRGVRQQVKRAEGELTETQRKHREYWTTLIKSADGRYKALSQRPAYKGNWQTAESMSVNSIFYLDVTTTKSKDGLRSELYLYGPHAKHGFDFMKDIIIQEGLLSDFDVTWERQEDRTTSRIAIYRGGQLAQTSEEEVAEQEWIVSTLKQLASVAHDLVLRLRNDPTPLDDHLLQEKVDD